MGFAIPANDVVQYYQATRRKEKKFDRMLGIQMMDLSNLSTSDLSQLESFRKKSLEGTSSFNT